MALMNINLGTSPFDNLPLDIVEHIILKGCEMETPKPEYMIVVGNTVYDGPCSRRRKPFAQLSRRVCSQWKRLIDSEEKFSLSRFWFACLVLAIPSYHKWVEGGDNRGEYVSFVRQMLAARNQLANSNGCDLYVLLASSNKLPEWTNGMDPYGETGSMLKLLAYAILDLKNYGDQIVSIEPDLAPAYPD